MFWYPFQSDEVREICQRLTPAERKRLQAYFWKGGGGFCGVMGLGFAVPLLLATLVLPSLPLEWSLAANLVIVVLYGGCLSKSAKMKTRELLCETEYARRIGYTPDVLPLYRSRFSLRTALLWAMPFAAFCFWLISLEWPFVLLNDRSPAVKFNVPVWLTIAYVAIFDYAMSKRKT